MKQHSQLLKVCIQSNQIRFAWIDMRVQEHCVRKLESKIKLVENLKEKKKVQAMNSCIMSFIISWSEINVN